MISNENLRLGIRTALAADPATDPYGLLVDAEEGRVTLSGIVESWREKQLSEEVVKSVKGVQELENQIRVKPAAVRPDEEIETEVIRRLQSDMWVREKLIGVIVEKGKVTLPVRSGVWLKNTAHLPTPGSVESRR